MQWLKFPDLIPPIGQEILVVKQYLDAPFVDGGYQEDKNFWTEPMIVIDSFWGMFLSWKYGGKVTHWMPLPELPNGMD
jgi:Protein of unknown function (DUF551)